MIIQVLKLFFDRLDMLPLKQTSHQKNTKNQTTSHPVKKMYINTAHTSHEKLQ